MLRALLSLVPIAGLAAAAAYVLGLLPPADPTAPGASAAIQPERVQVEPEMASLPLPQRPVFQQELPTARDVTPPGMHSGPVRSEVPVPPTPPAEEAAPLQRFHRVVVTEAGALKAGDTTIRLAGIDAPGIDETCTDSRGADWPCGRAAAAALQKLIRNRAVECETVEEASSGIIAHCSVGQRGLSEWLVTQGWAEAAGEETYADAQEAAREEQRGMFIAEWRRGGGSVAIPEPAGTAALSDNIAGPAISISVPPAPASE